MSLALAALAAGALMWPTAAGGNTDFVTTHGISMAPSFRTGDLAVVRATASYQVGDVVAYHSRQLRTVVLHRIVARDGAGFVFKGDNNTFLDPEHPVRSQLIGKLALRIPHGGSLLNHLTAPPALGLLAFTLLASGGAAVQTRRTIKRRRIVSRHAAHPIRATPKLTDLGPQLRAAAVAGAASAVAALTLGTLAWMGPVTATSTTEHAANRMLTFSYSAAVPRSPAYDGTVATSPDPVFRRLANTVDVHFSYQGDAGSIAVTAQLSTPSGWHTTVALAPSRAFTTSRTTGEVRLDLTALEARARAAAASTGMPAEQLSVQVVPEIRSASTAPFRPVLNLALTPLQLKLSGDSTSLVVTDARSLATPSTTARTLALLGHHLSVATSRSTALVMLLLSVVMGAVVLLVARRTAPASEAAGIRQRYSPLLVSVQPMPTVPGRPVVDVTEFATLAKLAERYGLLVLHWSRSNVETFIVQDEGTTYRYRTGARPQDQPTGQEHPVRLSGLGS